MPHELIRVVNGIFQLVRVVKLWFMSRTDGELHIISETVNRKSLVGDSTFRPHDSRLVRVVKQWFTSHTGGELHIISKKA